MLTSVSQNNSTIYVVILSCLNIARVTWRITNSGDAGHQQSRWYVTRTYQHVQEQDGHLYTVKVDKSSLVNNLRCRIYNNNNNNNKPIWCKAMMRPGGGYILTLAPIHRSHPHKCPIEDVCILWNNDNL